MNENSTKKILIIEDDQFLSEFYQELLKTEGYNIEVAGDGEMGLTKILQQKWDLILLDIMLPKKDGLQILLDLKTQSQTTLHGPIVVLTNLGNDTVVNQAFELGASSYLIKSALNPDEVLSEIHTFLQKFST